MAGFSVQAEPVYQVLMVHAYSQEYPWTGSQHRGFVDKFTENSRYPVSISTEYLDTKRRKYDTGYAALYEDYLKAKYAGYSPDIIYVTDDNGYLFARQQLARLFPDAPIFFSGVNNYGIQDEIRNSNIRGVFENKEISENLYLIRDIDRENTEIIFVGDDSNTYYAIEREIKQQLRNYPEIKANFLAQDNIEELKKNLREHHQKYIFLTTIGGIKSAEGDLLNPQESISEIASSGDFIIVTMEDAYFTRGVLGGYVTSGRLQGEAAAELALQFQNGISLDEIGNITQSPNRYIFDQSELIKLEISLPQSVMDNALFHNIPPTIYERYRVQILLLLTLLSIALALLVGSIIYSRIRITDEERKREEIRTAQIEAYQNALIKWSATSHKNIEDAFRTATKISSATLAVNRVSIWLYNEERTALECSVLYVENKGHSSGSILHKLDFPHYFAAMERGRRLVIDDARTNPATRELTEPYLLDNDIYSMLDIPVFYDGQCIGVICHEHTGGHRKWTLGEQEFCALLGSDISLALEIDKRKSIEKNLEYHAFHDALTDLPNRALLLDRIEQAARHAKREHKLIAVLFLDLDNFKHINDSFGHSVGDTVLVTVASRFKQLLRADDTVSRLGGDEFTILVSEFKNIDDVNKIATKLLAVVQKPILIDDKELVVNTSIGISVYPNDGTDAETLLRNADAAMYRAKEKGRNAFEFYTEDMTVKALEKVHMIANLKRALEQNEFEIYYQPQIDIDKNQLLGLEALIRWQHPELGLIAPAKFLPAAEESGLLVALDRWVMRHSFTAMKAWMDCGHELGRLSLNLTMQQIDQRDFLDFLAQLMLDSGCPGDSLTFEITEGQLMKNPERTVEILGSIAAMGIKISIDDFGTGYSSLAYLKRLPVDMLKIDREFIREIPRDEDDASIVRSVIALAKGMKIEVLAEGVETDEQLEFLKQEGCNLIQGYYFSRPVENTKVPGLVDIPRTRVSSEEPSAPVANLR